MSKVEVNSEALNLILSMGFPESQARMALKRTNNDIEHAVDMLSNGLRDDDDAEFDLISAADPEPEVRPPTVFKPRSTHDETHNDAFTNVTGGTIPEMVDSRISTFTEMGFTAQQAEDALRQTNGDVNEALNLLLNT